MDWGYWWLPRRVVEGREEKGKRGRRVRVVQLSDGDIENIVEGYSKSRYSWVFKISDEEFRRLTSWVGRGRNVLPPRKFLLATAKILRSIVEYDHLHSTASVMGVRQIVMTATESWTVKRGICGELSSILTALLWEVGIPSVLARPYPSHYVVVAPEYGVAIDITTERVYEFNLHTRRVTKNGYTTHGLVPIEEYVLGKHSRGFYKIRTQAERTTPGFRAFQNNSREVVLQLLQKEYQLVQKMSLPLHGGSPSRKTGKTRTL